MQRYQEAELISNRSPVLLYGGTVSERRAWAEEAASHFEAEGGLVWANSAAELAVALQRRGGVVAVEDVTALDDPTQGQILNCLMRQEERPKLVLGLRSALSAALQNGSLRPDLHYRLSLAQVDLSLEEVKQAIRAREPERKAREAGKKKAAELAQKARPNQVVKPPRRPVIAAPARPASKPNVVKTAGKASKPAAAAKGKLIARGKPSAAKKAASRKASSGKPARR